MTSLPFDKDFASLSIFEEIAFAADLKAAHSEAGPRVVASVISMCKVGPSPFLRPSGGKSRKFS